VSSDDQLETARQRGDMTLEKLGRMIGKGFAHNDKRFDAIESRLSKRENLLLAAQKREIEDLKKRMKRLEDAVAL
jgi:hypothetical protein